MNYFKNLKKLLAFSLLFTIGCKKNEVPQPTFEVQSPKNSYKVGEPVEFTFSGNPDFISFYSGTIGNDYDYNQGRIMEIKSFSLYFQSRIQAGAQNGQLAVLISSDFDGNFNMASVEAATWKDITHLFAFSYTVLDWFTAGEADITSLVSDKNKPLYIAFRYITLPQTTQNGAWRNTAIRNLTFNTVTSGGTNTALTQLSAGWVILEKGEFLESGRNSISASTGSITFRGNTTVAGRPFYTEAWAIATPINLSDIDVGPDKAIPIKNISQPVPSVFTHVFNEPGTFKCVFTASNNRLYGDKTIVKETSITIEP